MVAYGEVIVEVGFHFWRLGWSWELCLGECLFEGWVTFWQGMDEG